MIENITLSNNENGRDHQFNYKLTGEEDASTLAVMVSGMLYDSSNPPENYIFSKIKKQIAHKALSLEVEQMDNSFTQLETKRELTICRQTERISKSIEDVIDRHPNINNISYITHSMGSVVLYSLLRKQPQAVKDMNNHCFLLSPVPFDAKVDNLAKCTTESLLQKDTENCTKNDEIFIEKDGSKVTINSNVWQCLDNISGYYNEDTAEFGQFEDDSLNFFIAKNDKVFQNDLDLIKSRYPKANIEVLEATHSFKDAESSQTIIKRVDKEIV